MTKGLSVAAAVAVSCVGVAVGLGGTAAGSTEGGIDPRVLLDTAGGRQASFVIRLKDQADLTGANRIKNQDARGWYVYRALRQEAARTQGPVRTLLASRGVSYRSFWVANVIVARGDRSLVEDLAARPDVGAIESNDRSSWLGEGTQRHGTVRSPLTVEPGVSQVHAPDLWALGYTGQGIVIGKPGHRHALDAQRAQAALPGLERLDRRPQLQLVGRNSQRRRILRRRTTRSPATTTATARTPPARRSGTTAPATRSASRRAPSGSAAGTWTRGTEPRRRYTECFQFFIAPTDLNGQNADPTLRPHVLNNSWHCPPSEGCAADTLQTIVENTEAAGIFVEASADSDGPGCSTLADPPAIYAASFTTGAINGSSTSVAGFSSRGPVTIDGSNRIKPDLVAPGVNVRSSVQTATLPTPSSAARRWRGRTSPASSPCSGRRFRASRGTSRRPRSYWRAPPIRT